MSCIPVVVWKAEEPTAIEEAVIDRPGVDTDTDQVVVLFDGGTEATEHLPMELDHVPVEGRSIPLVDGDRAVWEPSNLLGPNAVTAHVTDDHSTASSAEIDRGDVPRAHRRNAAATPASTGMCSPVVWEKSDVQMANTAFATFSGTTSRLRIVRCA